MKVWKCPTCGQQKRTSDEKDSGPFCSRTHPVIRMELDDVELASESVARQLGKADPTLTHPATASGDDVIVWRDPPLAPVGRRGDERKGRFVAALRTRPGKWAVYPMTYKSNPPCGVMAKKFPGTEWVGRRNGDVYELYGRWIGGAS